MTNDQFLVWSLCFFLQNKISLLHFITKKQVDQTHCFMNQIRYKYVSKCLLSRWTLHKAMSSQGYRRGLKSLSQDKHHCTHTGAQAAECMFFPWKTAIVLPALTSAQEPRKEDLPSKPSQHRKMFIKCPAFFEREDSHQRSSLTCGWVFSEASNFLFGPTAIKSLM